MSKGRSIGASTIGCFSEVAAFQRLGIARFHYIEMMMTFLYESQPTCTCASSLVDITHDVTLCVP